MRREREREREWAHVCMCMCVSLLLSDLFKKNLVQARKEQNHIYQMLTK
jgi:predicted transcriptional regulator